jgi:hypothetical protein
MGRTWAKALPSKKKTVSVDDRLSAAAVASANATANFELAALELEAAAQEQREAAADAIVQAYRLNELAVQANDAAEKNERVASKIRDLFN